MPTNKRWRSVALLIVAVAALGLVAALLLLEPGPGDIRTLAVFEPLPVDVPRSSSIPGSFESLRAEALYLYAEGDYANARTPFANALLLRPDDGELRLYFGSALILEGDFERSIPSLSRAAASDDPLIRDEGLWQLANTQLALGRGQEARDTLARVIEMKGRHTSDARRLLDAMR